jgi:hypothetical protein
MIFGFSGPTSKPTTIIGEIHEPAGLKRKNADPKTDNGVEFELKIDKLAKNKPRRQYT